MINDFIHSNWIEVDLRAIENNISVLRELTGVEVMAVVKANGYGHGAVPVARAALRGGATWLGVARTEEALQLRAGEIGSPILVMGYASQDDFLSAINADISLTLWSREQLQQISQLASQAGKVAKLHLKIDSGMSRLGIKPEFALSLVEMVLGNENLQLEGVFTHFAKADEQDQSSALEQEAVFKTVLDEMVNAGIKLPLVHAANSAASLYQPSAHFDLVRTGIAIYGLHPSAERPLPASFRPALSWKAVISQVKTLPPGRGVSYGHVYITRAEERVGTIPVGYADGFRRVLGNQVLVGGRQVPVIGRVCMDQIIISLDGVPEAHVGQEVVIIGKQGEAQITAEQVADRWGTINYEVVCGLTARVPREYTSAPE